MRPALFIAMLRAVHAGGEQGWESGHLEPFFLGARIATGTPCLCQGEVFPALAPSAATA